jgi:hypothetical protein
MARIVVEDHSGLIWRGSNIEILIDGIERGKLKNTIRADFAVGAGKHTIQAQTSGSRSLPLHFVATERDTFNFACFSEGILKKTLVLKQISHKRHQDRF